MEIRITNDEDGLQVWQGDKTSKQLTLGELVEQVLRLLGLMNGQAFEMRTPEQWNDRFNRTFNQSKKETPQ